MSEIRTYTFRDAGLHSRLLRTLNACGRATAALGFKGAALDPESLREAARKQTGLDDFGPPGIDEALEVLHDSFEREAGLTTFGRMVVRRLLAGALANRLKLLDWAKRHPKVRDEKIESPWVILGMPRTGTTLLSRLLALDPTVRPLTQWEAGALVPPPTLANHAEDPRIAASARDLDRLMKLNPPFRAMHPLGATHSTECVTLFILDLRSLSIDTQGLVPSYGRWLEQTDVAAAYAIHKLGLQVLQSALPTQTWSLKTPQHLWYLDALNECYPDARLIWTHRDPRKVVTSVASLTTSMHKMTSDDVDPRAVGEEWNHKLRVGIERGMDFDERQRGRSWCHQLLYADLVADPVGAMERLYAHFGQELLPLHRRRIETWMQQRSQSVFGRHGYDPVDFGFSDARFDTEYGAYCERFSIPREG
ncbi:MAG: sulfotransferase [Deltaproteobacteria bacterium]|nr:sulfotransferase [Deltaproteobacteria bacterium]MBW2362110.1 sulfotransferase [Deltaproteobacteria bacterium]